MGVHIEAQDEDTYKQIRARELQLENTEKLVELHETVNNIDLDNIESNTNEIKRMVVNNLETQPNLEDVMDTINKIAQGISDIKRNQTNLNKKINDIQNTIDDIEG